MEQNQQQPVNEANKANLTEDLKSFYKGEFKTVLSTLFTKPIDGTYAIFKNVSPKSFQHAIILIVSLFVVNFLAFYIGAGESRGSVPMDIYLKGSLVPVVLVLCITFLSFIIKSIFAKGDLKNEMLTGAICAIPLGLLSVTALVYKMIQSDGVNLMNPLGSGKFFLLLMLYLLVVLINILQQSLKAAGTKDAVAFYVSPLAILLSFYLTYQITFEVLIG